MNKMFLYTIWEKVEDLVDNPNFYRVAGEFPDPELEYVTEEVESDDPNVDKITYTHPRLIFDPQNPSGVRYVAIRCVHDVNLAQRVCANSNGQYVYTFTEAWYGEN